MPKPLTSAIAHLTAALAEIDAAIASATGARLALDRTSLTRLRKLVEQEHSRLEARQEILEAGSKSDARPVGERIRLAREAQGLSQKELAERAGIAPPVLCRFEQGEREPRTKILRRIAEALGMEASELL
jgi:ribosome-binding protein aMBF1 (putative translation factor)